MSRCLLNLVKLLVWPRPNIWTWCTYSISYRTLNQTGFLVVLVFLTFLPFHRLNSRQEIHKNMYVTCAHGDIQRLSGHNFALFWPPPLLDHVVIECPHWHHLNDASQHIYFSQTLFLISFSQWALFHQICRSFSCNSSAQYFDSCRLDSWNLKTILFKNYLLWALPGHQWADKGLWSNQRTEQQFVHDWKQLWSCSIRGTWHPWSMSWDVAQASSTCVSSSHLQAWDGANL